MRYTNEEKFKQDYKAGNAGVHMKDRIEITRARSLYPYAFGYIDKIRGKIVLACWYFVN